MTSNDGDNLARLRQVLNLKLEESAQKAQELDVVTSPPKARLSGHPFSAEHAHKVFFSLNCPVSMLGLVSLVAFLARSVFSHQLFVIDSNLTFFHDILIDDSGCHPVLSHSLWK